MQKVVYFSGVNVSESFHRRVSPFPPYFQGGHFWKLEMEEEKETHFAAGRDVSKVDAHLMVDFHSGCFNS